LGLHERSPWLDEEDGKGGGKGGRKVKGKLGRREGPEGEVFFGGSVIPVTALVR
jgi:hypothetical protein